MANDIDMCDDIQQLDRDGKHREAELLTKCYKARFIDGDEVSAIDLKEMFVERYGYWYNYY